MRRRNGEGTIFKRSDGRWCAAFYDNNPRPKRHFIYGKTQAEVKAKLNERRENPDAANWGTPELFQDWALYYLENYKINEIKQSTFSAYYEVYRKHIKDNDIGLTRMKRLTSNQLQQYYNSKKEQGYSPKTIRHIHTFINSALNKAVQLRLIKDNVNIPVTVPKREAYETNILTSSEVKKIVTYTKHEPLYPIIVLALYTGLRKGELMALKWENINFEKKELSVKGNLCRVQISRDSNGKTTYGYKILDPKTPKSKRTIPLLPTAIEALKIQKARQNEDKQNHNIIYQDQDLVFARYDGTYLSQRNFMNEYHDFLKRYDITDVRFHDLRHTFASLLLEIGESPKTIQELLGHSTITTTMDIYTHVTNTVKVNAMMNFDSIFTDD